VPGPIHYGNSAEPAILFCCIWELYLSFFFSRLTSEFAQSIVTKLCHNVRRRPGFIKFGRKFGARKHETTWRLDRGYLQKATRCRQRKRNQQHAYCDQSHPCLLKLVNYCLQTAEDGTGVSTHPTGTGGSRTLKKGEGAR